MLAIVNTAPNKLELLELPLPAPAPGQVRIRVKAVGICATDLEMIAGWERTGFTTIPGHEWSGLVDKVGPGGDASLVGRRCVAENVWKADKLEVGFEHPGGYGEYLITEQANVQPLPDDYPFAAAAMIEPLAVSVRAMHRLRPDARGPFLIVGDGPIGLILVLLARLQGIDEVSLIGGRPARLALAQEFGATAVANYHEFEGDLTQSIRLRLGTFSTIIEASGNGNAANAAFNIVRPEGRVLVVGDYGLTPPEFHWRPFLVNETELITSNASAEAWPESVRLAVQEELPLHRLVSHTFPATQFQEAMQVVRHNREAVKVVMEWEEKQVQGSKFQV